MVKFPDMVSQLGAEKCSRATILVSIGEELLY